MYPYQFEYAEVAMSTKRRSTTSGQHSNGNSWYLYVFVGFEAPEPPRVGCKHHLN